MSELDLYGMIKHLPQDHKASLQYYGFVNTAASYLEKQQEVWKLRNDLATLTARVAELEASHAKLLEALDKISRRIAAGDCDEWTIGSLGNIAREAVELAREGE